MNTTSKLMKIEKIIKGLKGEKKAGNKSHNRKNLLFSQSLYYILYHVKAMLSICKAMQWYANFYFVKIFSIFFTPKCFFISTQRREYPIACIIFGMFKH